MGAYIEYLKIFFMLKMEFLTMDGNIFFVYLSIII